MIYADADSGCGGFAVDEFNDCSRWNRRLLTKSATITVKEKNSSNILGAAIIGICVCNIMLLLYGLFKHPHLLVQVAFVHKSLFPYSLDWLVPYIHRRQILVVGSVIEHVRYIL